jgi:hypothetical protein
MPHPLTACLLALVFYIAAALAFQAYVFTSRTSLPEPDDAYTYILKSPQIAEGCGLQDCPALDSLRAQFAARAGSDDAEWRRYRMHSRVFLVYHPLYSGLLLALNTAGLGWEDAFIAASCFGVLLIAAGIAFFLVTLWGPAAAALALLILAFSNFAGQGLTSIVPSNMALGLAFFAWGFALRGWRWSMTAVILAMLLMHPVGKVYGVVALAMAIAIDRDFRPGLRKLLPYLAVLALLGASVLLPMLISQPMLRIDPEPMPAGATLLGGLLANLRKAIVVVARGFGRGASVGVPLALAIYWLAWSGIRSAPHNVCRPAVIAFAALAGMCVLLLAHVLPHYPAEAFIRGWIALAVLIAGAAAFGLVGPAGILREPARPGAKPWRDPAIVCLSFLGLFAVSGAIVLAQQALKMSERHYQTFEPDQVRLLTQNCGTAMHVDETATLFYLSHGGNACPSIYLRALKGEGAARLSGLKEPLMLVAAKPGPQEIAIARKRPVELTIAQPDARQIYLKLVASSPDVRVEIHVAGLGEAREITPARTDGVVALDLPPGEGAKTVTLAISSLFDQAHLEGLSLDGEPSGWPWNQNVILTHRNRSYAFTAPALTDGLFASMEVIDSRGSTVLAKLRAPN